MVVFYTDISQLTQENRKIVFPMLFDWYYLENPIVRGFFRFSDEIDQADICVLPVDINNYLNKEKNRD